MTTDESFQKESTASMKEGREEQQSQTPSLHEDALEKNEQNDNDPEKQSNHNEDSHRPDTSTADDAAENEEDAFEVKFDGLDDPMNPKSKSKAQKWLITAMVSSGSVCVTCASSMYVLIYGQIDPLFHTNDEVATIGLSTFIIGLGLGPMFLAPLSEFYGRRPIYIISFIFFFIWLIPCALAQNIQTLIIARFFSGLSGSAFLSIAGGTVGDLFLPQELSAPMAFYTASPLASPELGPLLAGFINYYTDWRWTFWVLLIWSGVEVVLITLFVPETYHPVLLRNKARKVREETGEPRWQAPIERMNRSVVQTVLWSCLRPFQLLLFEPMCLNLCLLSALLLGIIYLFFGAFPLVFENNHGFNLWQVGLSFCGLLVGILSGAATMQVWQKYRNKLIAQNKGVSEPEFRLPPTVAGAVLVPIGLFGFAWTSFPSVHWIVPIVFSGIFAVGVVWIFSGVWTFLVDCYPLYAASALAANSFARSSFAAVFPLFGVYMYNRLGYEWASSLLAFLAVAMAPFPYLFFRYGKQLRRRSRFATSK